MAQQTNNDVTRGALVPDINGINALACKIGRELKSGAISAYLFVNDNKVALAALGISVALLAELLSGNGASSMGADIAARTATRSCITTQTDCNFV